MSCGGAAPNSCHTAGLGCWAGKHNGALAGAYGTHTDLPAPQICMLNERGIERPLVGGVATLLPSPPPCPAPSPPHPALSSSTPASRPHHIPPPRPPPQPPTHTHAHARALWAGNLTPSRRSATTFFTSAEVAQLPEAGAVLRRIQDLMALPEVAGGKRPLSEVEALQVRELRGGGSGGSGVAGVCRV